MNEFKEITNFPDQINGTNVLLRLIEGIGFRYFWGTEGLTESDIMFDPGNGSRTMQQTLDHLYYMALFAGNTLEGVPTVFPETPSGLPLLELRNETLNKMAEIKTRLASMTDPALASQKILAIVNGDSMEFNIWQLVNGPFLDMGYHIGQIISMRRINGNPISPGVEPFFGKKMN